MNFVGTFERPLPFLTELNQAFWQGGSIGELRIQQCPSCASFQHPPLPTCARCAAADGASVAVSGDATIVGFSVNHYQWRPEFPPPYIVATVALVEDPTVRITTNIVDCSTELVHVGMPVRVRFENAGDVWFPLFAPAGGPDRDIRADDPPVEDVASHVRPMVRTRKFEDDVVISGVGMSEIGRRLGRNPLDLASSACHRAISDAGLAMSDIDGLATYPGEFPGTKAIGPAGGFSEGGVAAVAEALRVQPVWYFGGAETFGPIGPVIEAMLAISAGLCRHVLCFRTMWQATHRSLGRPTPSQAGVRIEGPLQWSAPFGASASTHLAQSASNYMRRFGVGRETFGWIALNARTNAGLDPDAIYREPLTMDEYMEARLISTPFGLYDCDVPCDASVAVVVSARDDAGGLPHSVAIEAVGTQMIERVPIDQSTISHEPQVFGAAAHLWSRTQVKPDEVDFAQLYDGFTFTCLSWIEAFQFCAIGEGKDFVAGGVNISRHGSLPVNTHGGQLSHGRTHGMGLLREAVLQLRGDAGTRQLGSPQFGVVGAGGLANAGAILLRADGSSSQPSAKETQQ